MINPVQEFNTWVDRKRADGMYEYNLAHLDQAIETLMRVRKPKTKDHMRMCSECKRFYSYRTFYKHKEECSRVAILSNKKH